MTKKIRSRSSKKRTKRPRKPEIAATQYARAVLAGEIIACKWVKLACQRHLDDLKRSLKKDFPYRFDEQKAEAVCNFAELMVHIKGPKAGQLIVLELWQKFFLQSLFGWVHKKTGKRRFRRGYLEVARGNAKSTIAAVIGLYMLVADDEGGAEIYSAATTRDQAKAIFAVAQQMVRKSPGYKDSFGVQLNANNIYQASSASKFEALSAEAGTLDGKNIYLALIDELHAHRTRGVYDVLETGTGKRDQSLLLSVTTAGTDRSGICYEVRTYLTKILDRVGDIADDSFFGIIYTIDDTDDWTDPKVWIKANPNWGISVMADVVTQLAYKAMQLPAAQNSFKTKHLNVWVNQDVAWMDMRAWDRCADSNLKMDDFLGEPCWVGLDLASRVDIAAMVMVFCRKVEEQDHYYTFGRYFLPEDAVTDARNSQYSGWEKSGRLITTSGDIIDYAAIEDELMDWGHRFEVKQVSYDPTQATQFSTRMRAEGFTMVDIVQGVKNFSETMKELEALVRCGRLHHDGDPVQTWSISNVVCHIDAKENIYPRKERPENKIDPTVSLIMALRQPLLENTSSVYNSRGLLTI